MAAAAAAAAAAEESPPLSSSFPPTQMTRISRHSFGESGQPHAFTLEIIENMQEDYGMFIWPCSIALAEYVWQRRSQFSGATVIELGAGTSLPGLVAAKVGAEVILTDDSSRLEEMGCCTFASHNCAVMGPNNGCSLHRFTMDVQLWGHHHWQANSFRTRVLDNVRKMCDLNKVSCKVMGLTWGEWDTPLFSLAPKIVLGADVLYDTNDFDDLFATVTFMLQNSAGSIFITTYHNRSGHHLIEYLMVKWGLKCTKILDVFSFMPSCKSSAIHGNIQLVEITLDS